MFAGHTDVVPPGDESDWTHAPFAGEIADGMLYGRGAVDMKGGIACVVAAALDHLAAHGGKPKGSISFLITGDEEGVAVNGTIKLLKWAAARGEKFDHCILGEPSNPAALGDTIKIGRRGSLNGTLVVTGKPGPRRLSAAAPTIRCAASSTLIGGAAERAARRRQRAFRSVESRIHLDRRRQPDRQPHSRRGARALQHPLQRLPHPRDRCETLIEQRAAQRPPARSSWRDRVGCRRMPTCSSPQPGPFIDLVSARGRRR